MILWAAVRPAAKRRLAFAVIPTPRSATQAGVTAGVTLGETPRNILLTPGRADSIEPSQDRWNRTPCGKSPGQRHQVLTVELSGIEIVDPSIVFAQLDRSAARPESGSLE